MPKAAPWLVEHRADCPCHAPALQQSPRCRCGMYELGDGCPYCEWGLTASIRERIDRDLVKEGARQDRVRREAIEALRAQLRTAGVHVPEEPKMGASQGANPAPFPAPQHRAPRKKRRSKAEMAAVRAKDAERAAAVHRTLPAWLLEGDEDLNTFTETIRD